MNVQIYFFMSKMFPCDSVHCRARARPVAGGMLSWTEAMSRGHRPALCQPREGDASPGTQQVPVVSSFPNGNMRGINCCLVGFFVPLCRCVCFSERCGGEQTGPSHCMNPVCHHPLACHGLDLPGPPSMGSSLG